ncbi:MAG: ABC transporter ATP-binding protein [Oscillospiraceae bacterium]
MHNKGPAGPAPQKGTLGRLIKMLFSEYRSQLIIVIAGMVIVALVSTVPSVFIEKIAGIITEGLSAIRSNGYTETSQFKEVYKSLRPSVIKIICGMAAVFAVGLAASFVYTRLNAVITQGFLYRLRKKVFKKMQSLPVKYFDTHNHGDIMSHYTNDIDTLRQLISQALPNVVSSALTIVSLLFIMLYYSLWLTLTVGAGVVFMFMVTKTVGGNSARFFIRQQESLGKTEGYIEEMINGQKVVKVFCHEESSKQDFNRLNEQLFEDAKNANKFANILMPIMGNIGNILYVLVAFIGGIISINGWFNPSLRSLAGGENILSVPVIVTYLGMTRQFCQSISQVSQQVNSVVMALAGAGRIFSLLDESPEEDEGYVELVNAVERNGQLSECLVRTGLWAWKHRHENGSVTYTPLQGRIIFDHVDFGYTPEKMVLNDITLYAEQGQKIALVGSTGAGKTTITNLINRFYDIQDGKIRYDDININKIRKSDLRRSLSVVLQDVNLFSGTVMDNIRYGNLDATDEECIAAAKLANADSFIRMLPDGYNTVIKGDGSDLSQGQKQLLSIARAAIANPPLMILDEATSSIDTRTELIVQKGMDALMKGRTVFVIAHRLSTIRNSDVILVMDQGRIIERGSHDQLIAARGTYYRLYTGSFELS